MSSKIKAEAEALAGMATELATAADSGLSQDHSLRRIAGKAARIGGWALDLDRNQLYWSDEVCEIHDLPAGYQPTLAEGLGYFPEHVRQKVQDRMQACISDGIAYDLELPKLTATGRSIWVRSIGEAVRDEHGRIFRLQGAFQDISSDKRREQRLLEQATMLANANDAITATDINWCITYWNKAAERLYGWTAAEVLGHRWHELLGVAPALLGEYEQELHATGNWKGDITKITRQGRRLVIQASWTLMRDEHNKPSTIFAIGTDVTRQRQMAEQLRESQKMEAIGVLAGGIAHDFNNLLMVINGYSESLQEAEGLTPELRNSAAIINRAGTKAATLTRQLLGFSRQTFLQKQVFDLNTIVPNVAGMLDSVLGPHIQLVAKLEPDLRPVSLDPEQMEQVLMNLIINARDAMPAGGALTVETANVELKETVLTQQGQADPGNYVMLSVTDTGTGMSAELLKRIFEPFFTTKEVGKGSGLGLSMVLGIIQQSGGWIDVSSESGQGSCFRIYFPVSS